MRRWLPVIAVVVLLALAVNWWTRQNGSSAPLDGEAGTVTSIQAESGLPGAAGIPGATAEPRVIEAVAESGVKIRLTRMPRLDAPSPPLGPKYERLRAGAETAPPATQYRLGQLLYRCRDVPADDAGLAQQIDQLYQTRRHNGWEVDDPGQEERALRQDFSDCAGVPGTARGEYRDWMKRAADAGLLEAQLNLMYHLPKAEYCQFIEDCTPEQAKLMMSLREESRALVDKALKAGSVEAFRTIGGWSLNEEMGTPDDVEAYANFSAYDQIQQAAGRERELGAMLAGIRKRLRPVDLTRAEERARELLSNPNCCVLTR